MAVVAAHKERAVRHDAVKFTAGWATWFAVIGIVGVESIGVLIIIDSVVTVFEHDTLAREGDDTFDDVFVGVAHGVLWVFEHDDLAALGYILLVLELCPGDGQAVYDQAIASVERFLHAGALDIEAAKDVTVDEDCSDQNGNTEKKQASSIFKPRVAFTECLFHCFYYNG